MCWGRNRPCQSRSRGESRGCSTNQPKLLKGTWTKVPKNMTPRTMAWVQIFLHLFLSEPPMAFILWSQNKQERQKNHPCLYQPPHVTGECLGHGATSLGHAWSPFIPLPQFRSLLSL